MFEKNTDDERCPPSMERTKIQISTSYSPGALFAFENSLLVCQSIPKNRYDNPVRVEEYTKFQIFGNIEERVKSWFKIAMSLEEVIVKPQMCVDKDFLNYERTSLAEDLNEKLFGFVEPDRMGYEPTLLTMVCSHCKRVKVFEDLQDFDKRHAQLRQGNCDGNNSSSFCDWRQMDIVFVHPNGNWLPPVPWTYEWDQKKGNLYKKNERCLQCNSAEIKIEGRSSQIGKRFFYCADCGMKRSSQWLQNDKEYIKEFGDLNGLTIADIRMKPISCRANSVHYPQQDMVIDFGDGELLKILKNPSLIEDYIAGRFSIPSRKLSLEEKKKIVTQSKGEHVWDTYIRQKETLDSEIKSGGLQIIIETFEKEIQRTEKEWERENIFPHTVELPSSLNECLRSRHEWYASKYDPFRLLVEHAALIENIVNNRVFKNGLCRFTSLDNLDNDIGPSDMAQRIALNKRHRGILDSIGIDTLGLVREFKTLHYSFGYTRVGSSPTVSYINSRTVPVRLNLFPKTLIEGMNKHPIFILKQDNEAIYVKLNEKNVRMWLEKIDPSEIVNDKPIGLQYLMHVPKMDMYLDNLPSNNILDKPQFSLALYTLLHTYAHHVMTSVSEYSGLSVGSLGEYLFPADLAFVIYRRGVTMDLGNLNSLLRNNSQEFLEHLANRRNLGCGSGSLCLSRGGACPNCLLIPEVSCIAQNKLLSRSTLIGKDYPRNYGFNKRISGYIDVCCH